MGWDFFEKDALIFNERIWIGIADNTPGVRVEGFRYRVSESVI
jgi:hypothetical protein